MCKSSLTPVIQVLFFFCLTRVALLLLALHPLVMEQAMAGKANLAEVLGEALVEE